MLIDTHAHLDFPEFANDLEGVLNRARNAGVFEVVTIGIDLDSSQKAVGLAQVHPEIYATVGIHPHDAFALRAEDREALEALAGQGAGAGNRGNGPGLLSGPPAATHTAAMLSAAVGDRLPDGAAGNLSCA